jgi:hypothetical protein
MTRVTNLAAVVAAALIVAACGPAAVETDDEPQQAQGAATSEPPVTDEPAEDISGNAGPDADRVAQALGGATADADEEAADADAEMGEIGVPDTSSGDIIADESFHVSGARWRAKGFRIQVTELHFTSVENICPDGVASEHMACWDVEDNPWQTLIAATIEVRNRTGRTVDAYPDQAVMVLGDAQADATMEGESVGGTFYDGVEQEGQATWKSKRAVDELVEIGKARLVFSQPYWTKSYDNLLGANNYDDVDLTITW